MNLFGQDHIIGPCWNLQTRYGRDEVFYHNQGIGGAPQGPSHSKPEAAPVTTLGWVLLISQAEAELRGSGRREMLTQGNHWRTAILPGRCLRGH